MGDIRGNLKRFSRDVNVGIGRIMSGDLSMFDKGDRIAFTVGGVIGAILVPGAAFAANGDAGSDIGNQIGSAFDSVWSFGLKIAWGLAAVMALIAIIWTIAAGSKEVSKPLAWLRRIVLAVIGINFIMTVIMWAKNIGDHSSNPGSLMGD